MTSRFLIGDIKHEEDLRLTAYPDPLSGGDPWTIGYGHTGPLVHQGLTITETQADVWLRHDVTDAKIELSKSLPWWTQLDDNRQDVLVQMGFQMGVPELLNFTVTLAAAKRGDYQRAADAMLASKWAQQTEARANRMACQMRSGLRAWARMDGK